MKMKSKTKLPAQLKQDLCVFTNVLKLAMEYNRAARTSEEIFAKHDSMDDLSRAEWAKVEEENEVLNRLLLVIKELGE